MSSTPYRTPPRTASGAPTAGPGFLRAPRRGAEIRLNVEGRVATAEEIRAAELATPEITSVAATIVELAQERADALVREAALTAAAVQQEAYLEGFSAGQREGVMAARDELWESIALVQRVGIEVKALRDEALAQAEHEIIDLVIAATMSVIGDRIAADMDLVHETVRRALERAGSQNVMRVRVAPEEQERVSMRLVEERGTSLDFEVRADGTVRLGGCIVDTASGRVDARLDVQMDEVAALLREALPARDDDNLASGTDDAR